MNLKTICFIGVFIILSGCNSIKVASKGTFTKTLNDYFDKSCIMVSTPSINFPVTVTLLPVSDIWAKERNPEKTAQYDALLSIGFLTVEEGKVQVKLPFIDKTETAVTKTYSLTKNGKKAFTKEAKVNAFGVTQNGFCAAKYQVSEIIDFSEPTLSIGYMISKINYKISPDDTESWANNDMVLKAFPRFVKEMEKNQEKSATLILVKDTWIHKRDFKR